MQICRMAFWLNIVAIWMVCRALAQPPGPPPETDLSPVRFSEVLGRFAEQQKVNVLAEYLNYEESGSVANVSLLRDAPTLEKIASVFGRRPVRVGDTIVLQTVRFFEYQHYNEEREIRIFGDLVWKGGKLEVQAKKNEDGTMKVSIRASGIPLKRLCDQFQKETGWKLHVDPELHNTRILARWHSVSPGEVVEAISVLLQTEVEATLMLREAQKEARKQAKVQLLKENPRAERWRRSDELLQDLLALLTPEEMERFKRGELVEFPLSRLPADIYDRALDYVRFAIDELLNAKPDEGVSQLRDRLRETEIILYLPSMVADHIFATGIGISIRHPETGQMYTF